MKNSYIRIDKNEKLILEPKDWTKEEWDTILKLFGMESAERIVISEYIFEAFGKPNENLKRLLDIKD